MRTLSRYVLAQLAKVFLFSLVALTLLLLIGGLVREAVAQSLPPAQVARLIPYLLPEMLCIAVPVTLLLATTTVYSGMSGANEVLAIKSLGISPLTLLWPAIVAGFALSLVTVWLNDLAFSWGRIEAQRVVIEAVEDIAYGMLRTQKQYSSSLFSINVKAVEGRRLILPTLTLKQRGSKPPITITAEEAELRSDHRNNTLKIILRNGTVDFQGKAKLEFPDVKEWEIPLGGASRVGRSPRLPSWMALRAIREQTGRQKVEIRQYQEELAARAAYEMLCGDFKGLTSEEWDTRHDVLAGKWEQLYRLQTEPCRRWSAGFSCLCFLWVGAPLAILLRNSDFFTSFALCFLPILIVYYPFLIYTIDASKSGTLPPVSIWTGNGVLLIAGAYLLRKVIRY